MKILSNLIASKFVIIALFFVFSCNQSYDAEMQKLEMQDNQFCVGIGLTPNVDDLLTEIYWRCRIYKMQGHTKFTSRIKHLIGYNKALDRLDQKVKIDYKYYYEQWTKTRNDIFDNNDHNLCIMQGHDIKNFEATKLEDYLSCRRRLIRDQQIIPPFNKTQYFNRPQDSYNIGFAINKKLDAEIIKFNAAKEKYPFCVKFDLYSSEFKSCTIDYDNNRQCVKNIPKLRLKRELAEKVLCQKKSYVRFPDSLLKNDNSNEEELRKFRTSADLKNNSSFFSIGIDKNQLEKFEAEKMPESNSNNTQDALKKDETKNEITISSDKKISRNFNSKNELYTKIDLTRLRQEFAFSCQKSVDPEIKLYQEKLEKECQDIVQKWETNEQR